MKNTPHIIVHCNKTGPRHAYIAGFFTEVLGVKMDFHDETMPVHQDVGDMCFIISYSRMPQKAVFSIFDSGLLCETAFRKTEPGAFRSVNTTLLFPAPQDFDLPFDLFSGVFYMLSRYEEYLPFTPDAYGRFEADQSLAFRHGFLDDPVVDQWLNLFKKALKQQMPSFQFTQKDFRFISTIDVDNPWAYLNKGFVRQSAGVIKSMFQLHNTSERISVLSGREKDPYDTFDFIRDVENRLNFHSYYFLLLGNYGNKDPNFAVNSNAFKNLVGSLAKYRKTGIHPSYKSSRNSRVLQREMRTFERLTGSKPLLSRQHFLCLRLPETYRLLTDLGIQSDFSMGFASMPGFRAGTTLPFRFYDLLAERETKLVIMPFAVMDVTLRQYMQLTPDEASEKIQSIILKIYDAKGVFTPLWHNESLSDKGLWKGWKNVFLRMAETVMQNNPDTNDDTVYSKQKH